MTDSESEPKAAPVEGMPEEPLYYDDHGEPATGRGSSQPSMVSKSTYDDLRAHAERLQTALTRDSEGVGQNRTGCVSVPRETLEAIISALDRGLGDTDITYLETDEEIKEEAPIQWACTQLSLLLAASGGKP